MYILLCASALVHNGGAHERMLLSICCYFGTLLKYVMVVYLFVIHFTPPFCQNTSITESVKVSDWQMSS